MSSRDRIVSMTFESVNWSNLPLVLVLVNEAITQEKFAKIGEFSLSLQVKHYGDAERMI